MTEKQIISLIENTLEEKIKLNSNYIKYSFYEINVKYNLNESDKNLFLKLIKNKLENNNYIMYSVGQKYEYNGIKKEVLNNEILVAIKSQTSK